MVVNVHKAKTELSKLIALAEAGEEVVIARAGTAAVKLVVVEQKRRFSGGKRPLGRLGKTHPLPADFEERWKEHKAELARIFDNTPAKKKTGKRVLGGLRGKLNLPPDWEEQWKAMDADIERAFYGPLMTGGDE